MPSFRKRNGRIQAQVRVSGSRQSATFSSLKEAKVWAFKLEAKLMANHHVSHRYRPTNPAEILIEYSSRLVESRPSALNEKFEFKNPTTDLTSSFFIFTEEIHEDLNSNSLFSIFFASSALDFFMLIKMSLAVSL